MAKQNTPDLDAQTEARLRSAIQSTLQEDPPAALSAQIRAAVAAGLEQGTHNVHAFPLRRRWWVPLSAAASIVFASVLGWKVWDVALQPEPWQASGMEAEFAPAAPSTDEMATTTIPSANKPASKQKTSPARDAAPALEPKSRREDTTTRSMAAPAEPSPLNAPAPTMNAAAPAETLADHDVAEKPMLSGSVATPVAPTAKLDRLKKNAVKPMEEKETRDKDLGGNATGLIAPQTPDAPSQLRQIKTLIEQGKIAEAKSAANTFKAAHPDYSLPPEIAALLEKGP